MIQTLNYKQGIFFFLELDKLTSMFIWKTKQE